MPPSADLITARSSVLFGGPPMLIFATAGSIACFVTQSTPCRDFGAFAPGQRVAVSAGWLVRTGGRDDTYAATETRSSFVRLTMAIFIN